MEGLWKGGRAFKHSGWKFTQAGPGKLNLFGFTARAQEAQQQISH